MDWRPISRSRSRPSPAMEIQVDNVLSQPQRFTFSSLEHPSNSKPSDMHSPLRPSADDQLALNHPGSAPPSTSNIPIGSSRQSPTSLFAHNTFPFSTLHEHTSHALVQRFSLTHPPLTSHHPSNSSFPSAPSNFTVPGYDGFFDLHATHSFPHDYFPILTTVDGSRHVPSYHENPHSSLSTTPYSPHTSPPLTSDEDLSATAVAASAAVAEGYARLTGLDGGLEYPYMTGFMYTNGGEATNLPFTHVDPAQISPVDYGESGFSSLYPSPSSDGWGNGFASSTGTSPEPRSSASTSPPFAEGSLNRQGVREIASTKRIQDAVVRSAIARRSTAGSDPPSIAQLRSSTSTADLTPAAKGGGPKSEDEETALTVCTNCQTTNTPLWRRDPEGQPLCK
jgi:hypothetical protein